VICLRYDLQGQLEAAEEMGGKSLKNQIKKLEQRIMDLESDLDTEGRKSAQVVKAARKSDMRVKDLEMQLAEEKKAVEKVNAAADSLTDKLRKVRLNLEATEQEKSAILAKYKRAAGELNEAEQRSEAAEAALQKQRQRTRAATAAGTAAGTRQQSRARTPNVRD
jgi:myosin protein heavy chain/myosin heavy chain 6/7